MKNYITFQVVASKGPWAQAVLILMGNFSIYKRRLHAARYLDLSRQYIAKGSQTIYLYFVRHSVEGITQRNPLSAHD